MHTHLHKHIHIHHTSVHKHKHMYMYMNIYYSSPNSTENHKSKFALINSCATVEERKDFFAVRKHP